jgi:hypothetical protein
VTKAELQTLHDEWSAQQKADSDRDLSHPANEDYFWHGAASFREYIEQRLEAEQKQEKGELVSDENCTCEYLADRVVDLTRDGSMVTTFCSKHGAQTYFPLPSSPFWRATTRS